jgi:hypothetical protein
MSQQTLDKTIEGVEDRRSPADSPHLAAADGRHADIAGLLSQMTVAERIRAYRSGVFSHRELFNAAAREPERMPICNGEFEWITLFLADLD